MTLPSSGPMTLAMLQTEYGGKHPIGLNEYYRGGAYVRASGTTVTDYYDRYDPGGTYWFTDSTAQSSGYYLNGTLVADSYAFTTTSVYQQSGSTRYYKQRGDYEGGFYQFTFYRLISFTQRTTALNPNVPEDGEISLSNFYGQGN